MTFWQIEENTRQDGQCCLSPVENFFIAFNLLLGYLLFIYCVGKILSKILVRYNIPETYDNEQIEERGSGLTENEIEMIKTIKFSDSCSLTYASADSERTNLNPSERKNSEAEPSKASSVNCCTICLNNFEQEEVLKILPGCLHYFHSDCIRVWLKKSAMCPNCRKPLTKVMILEQA